MKVLGIFTWIILSVLVGSLLHAWALSKLWLWFVSAQYGSGPTIGAWYGLTVIGQLMLRGERRTSKASDKDEAIAKAVEDTLSSWAGALIVLGMTWCIGSAFGWVR